jgi:hypothetical protein
MSRLFRPLAGLVVVFGALAPLPAASQDWTRREFPLAPPNSNGNFVAPFFDGWFQNEDGTYTLSFGFMNRNDEDLVEIPIGPDNFIEPAQYNGGQPTSFPVVSYPGFGGPRERGVFAVVVPEDFTGDVWWTLTTDGYTTRVPGRLKGSGRMLTNAYTMSTTPQAEGSLRPSIRFDREGPDGIGVVGIHRPGKLTTKVGEPVEVQFWAFDRGERELKDVNMTLWKHQGPVGALVAFESRVDSLTLPGGGRGGPPPAAGAPGGRGGRGRVQAPGPVDQGQSVRLPIVGPNANIGRFRATFDTPGEYVIRVRIDNFTTGDSSPGNQCCWSNGYVGVSVTE